MVRWGIHREQNIFVRDENFTETDFSFSMKNVAVCIGREYVILPEKDLLDIDMGQSKVNLKRSVTLSGWRRRYATSRIISVYFPFR